jgi:hypothetical protein
MTPEKAVKDRLTAEIQDMILENVLLSQKGPLRSACEAAVNRKRRSLKVGDKGDAIDNGGDASRSMQSTVPAADNKIKDASDISTAAQGRPISPKKPLVTLAKPPMAMHQAGDARSGHVRTRSTSM